jgi:hypothetical protein
VGDSESIIGELQAAEVAKTAAALETKVATARRERDVARTALRETTNELTDAKKQLALIEKIEDLDPSPPKWLSPKKPSRSHRAITVSILSDCHFDEVVLPQEVGGVNAYNREIATKRLERFFSKHVELSRDYLAGVTYDGAVLMLGGDMFSGDIHEELVETNEDTILGSLLYWSELLAAGIEMFADEYGKVHVPVVAGNHGRRTRKPRMKMRARDNFDWFLGHLLAREFKNDNRVTFDIPDSADCLVEVYDTTHLLTHGDQFRGGSGIAGVFSPIMRGDAKKRQRQSVIDQPYDVMVMGHFHQLIWGGSFIVNGSSKGYDEYAFISNFNYELPQQAMWLVTPEHGLSWHVPILVQDRAKEGW